MVQSSWPATSLVVLDVHTMYVGRGSSAKCWPNILHACLYLPGIDGLTVLAALQCHIAYRNRSALVPCCIMVTCTYLSISVWKVAVTVTYIHCFTAAQCVSLMGRNPDILCMCASLKGILKCCT